MAKTVKVTRRRILRKKSTGNNGVDGLISAGIGAGIGGAAVGGLTGLAAGSRSVANQKKRIPLVATRVANRAINTVSGAELSRNAALRNSADAANMGLGYARSNYATRGQVNEQYRTSSNEAGRAEKLGRTIESIKRSGRMEPSVNKARIRTALSNMKPTASLRKTAKLAKRGAVIGGLSGAALATLAQLVAKELKKKG